MKVIERIDSSGKVVGHGIWCPACDTIHHFPADRWKFNGDMRQPTFSPSMLLKCNTPDLAGYNPDVRSSICHSVIADGKIMYCSDCTHEFKGKTVELPDIEDHIKLETES